MPSSASIAFTEKIVQHLNQVAPVTARSMFGGYGLYADGVIFALIVDETLYFKIDDENRTDYLEANMGPFVYERHGQPIQMSYYQLPDTVLDNPVDLLSWIEKSQAAARRSQKSKKSKKVRPATNNTVF